MNSTHPTANSGLIKPSPQECQEQLLRIVHSETFRHATALQRLLQYLGAKATRDPTAEIKEYTIGTEVFERGPDYDPKTDTIVRVQIHRLRLKLKDFYESEGRNDQVLVDVPKGHYLPGFEVRAAVIVPAPVRPALEPASDTAQSGDASSQAVNSSAAVHHAQPGRSLSWPRVVVVVLMAILLFASGLLLGTRRSRPITSNDGESFPLLTGTLTNAADDPVRIFWAGFLGNDRAPVVGYADAVFLVDDSDDLFRYRRGASDDRGTPVEPHLAQQFASNPALVAKAGPLYYEDGYTGTGDVESIFALTHLFTLMGLQMTVERCRLVTIDDLKQHNVILLGSPDQNDAVAQLPQIADFVFTRQPLPGPWRGEFVNRHPQPGESLVYNTERDPNTQEVIADYGLITVQPGAVPGRYIAILGGLDTSGVAGTAQFMTSPSDMAELQRRLEALGAWTVKTQPPTFQALLRVDVEKGHDVLAVHIIAVHIAQTEKANADAPGPINPG
jgi:hypothetical protein